MCDTLSEIDLRLITETDIKSVSCPFAQKRKSQELFKSLPPDQDVCGNVITFTDTAKFLNKIIHHHEDYTERLKSFDSWPRSAKQKPEDLAEAGFYYKGEGDKTICFACSGPLNNWEIDDDPWEQHAFWYPKCRFVLEKKGKEFVDAVKQKLKQPKIEDMEILSKEIVNEDNLCIICCSSQRGVVLVPCEHKWTCLKCVQSLEHKKCPVCREQIVQIRM